MHLLGLFNCPLLLTALYARVQLLVVTGHRDNNTHTRRKSVVVKVIDFY